ncbi:MULTISPECIES: hypothetical protein [unclassified Acidovorax]|uniref:hypothetical protein n=1 Tax=unclassified Acidovorax TaxID=2684926 RepID=UPI001C471F74|nr:MULTISPECIES: hypothetical protein [unclassified Acidovorax]MBV7461198.1 hypothetical protein [Acidovorax sp. sif0632]MBV7466224.1 hypothetical protein [Acidovorax sp. sif0613]
MLPLQCFAFIFALACVPPAWAGMDKEGASSRPGFFFAWLSPDDGPVWAHFDQPAHLQQLVQHCNKGAPVFALQAGIRYQCKAELPPRSAGQEDPYAAGLTVQGPVPQADTRQYRLFALTPPRTPQWLVGTPDAEQLGALKSFLQSDDRRFGALHRQLKLESAITIHQPQGARTTVVVPGQVVRDLNAFYEAQRHHVFVRGTGGYAYMGQVPGKLDSYVDIDGNDLPGLVVSEGCDGWCISLWSLTGGLRQVATFGGH